MVMNIFYLYYLNCINIVDPFKCQGRTNSTLATRCTAKTGAPSNHPRTQTPNSSPMYQAHPSHNYNTHHSQTRTHPHRQQRSKYYTKEYSICRRNCRWSPSSSWKNNQKGTSSKNYKNKIKKINTTSSN